MTDKPKVLVVDDEANNRRLLEMLLAAEGHAVRCAASGEEALSSAAQQPPDLILLDIMMPDIDGFEVARRLKAEAATRAIPIIMVTALEDRQSRMRALQAGAEDFLTKPVDPAELLVRVRNLLRLKEYGDFLADHNRLLEEQVRERTASLQASEERLRGIMESARDAIVVVEGAGGIITGWNPAAEAIFGYGREEAIGRAIHTILPPPRFREAAQRGMAHFARTGEGAAIGRTLELAALHRNGTEFPIELSLSAMQLDGAWHAIGIARDISERKRAEDALRGSEERYRQLFESMGSGVAIYQPDEQCETFTFKSFNAAAERIERIRREELLGKSVEEAFPGVRDFGLLDVFRRVCRGGAPEHLPDSFYRDERISGWRDNYVYRLDSGEIVAVYDDVTERKRHEAEIGRLNAALRMLSACNVALVHARTEEELFRSVCRQIVETGGYRLAWVEYLRGEGEAPRVGAWFGDEAAFRRHAELAGSPEHADLCLTTLAQRTRQTEVCNDLRDMPARCFGPLREVGVEAILALPLLHNDEIHGVLTVFSSVADAFGAAEIRLAEELAGDLAYGIATLRTSAERDQGAVNLRQALEETIAAIALTLEKRDPYTAGHQQRVAGLASAIAAEMGLPPRQVEGIHFGALIHDIGKVYVPAEILNRPGKLNDLEFGLIQTHPQVGFDIVRDIPFPWPVAQMVHQHHERMDGSGYPLGLKGEEITLEARILAVADVVEAMSSHRPYRAALGIEAGLAEIERLRGTHFDAAAADACLRLFRERGYRLVS